MLVRRRGAGALLQRRLVPVLGIAFGVAWLGGCSSRSDCGSIESEAREDLASTIAIVLRARALRDAGAVGGPYLRVVVRENAADTHALARRLERAGCGALARRAAEIEPLLGAVAADGDAAARLEGLRAALGAGGSG